MKFKWIEKIQKGQPHESRNNTIPKAGYMDIHLREGP